MGLFETNSSFIPRRKRLAYGKVIQIVALPACFRLNSGFPARPDLSDNQSKTYKMVIILMGVTGSGKSTAGRKLAESLGWKYFDADDFHSPANVAKMKSGVPLNDEDRKPWLESLQRLIQERLANRQPAVLACSALKQSYREVLIIDERVKLVYLKGDYDLIKARLGSRSNHYMNPALLESQFQTLEEPVGAMSIDIQSSPDEIVGIIRKQFEV